MVDPQTWEFDEIRGRMERLAKLEPEYLEAMVESEKRLWVPKHEVPIARCHYSEPAERWVSPTLGELLESRKRAA